MQLNTQNKPTTILLQIKQITRGKSRLKRKKGIFHATWSANQGGVEVEKKEKQEKKQYFLSLLLLLFFSHVFMSHLDKFNS